MPLIVMLSRMSSPLMSGGCIANVVPALVNGDPSGVSVSLA